MRVPEQILYGRLLLALAGGFLCAALSYYQLVQPLDRMVYDIANEASSMPVADDIVIVAIDERSLLELGRWPWPREKHVELLRQLDIAGASAVAMDILFAERDTNYPQVDELLVQAMQAHGAVVLPVFIGQGARSSELREMLPVEPLASAAAGLGHVHIEVDSDGVARSVFLREGVGKPRWPHFTVALGEVLGLELGALPGVSDGAVLEQGDPTAIIRSNANLIPFMGPAGTVRQISYVDVMRNRLPAQMLRDRIVLVGATAAGHVDNITTSLGQISGVEINANIFHALRTGQLGRPASGPIAAFIAFVITATTILLFTRLGPRNLLLAVLSSAVVLPLASFFIFHGWRLWISPAPVVLTLLVAYPLWNWLRLDTAVSFLRAQLLRLEQENRQLSHHLDWPDVERAADFLQALGHVTRWQWVADIRGNALSESDRRWQRTESFCTRVFTIGSTSRRLRLYWHAGHENLSTILPQVFPDDNPIVMRPGAGADFININLAQLDFANREAQRNRDLVKGTLEQLGSGVILSFMSGDILLINERARELLALGQESQDLLAVMSRVEMADGRAVVDIVSQLVARGEHFSDEARSTATGRDLLCQGGVIRLDRPMLLMVLTDVSELKRSEKRRVDALNFLSHDLRAPLTSVLALIEGAKSGQSDVSGITLLEEIEKYIEKNLSYAENFIQLAKIEHEPSPRFDQCDAHSLIDDAVAQLFHAGNRRGIDFHLSYGNEDIWVSCNRELVERALINLIDNAIKYSRDGDSITITLGCDDHCVFFEVSDQGAGVNPDDMTRIFKQFQQGADARSGVGLGLRFVSAVASAHSGSVTVENNEVGGACFTLRIPLAV